MTINNLASGAYPSRSASVPIASRSYCRAACTRPKADGRQLASARRASAPRRLRARARAAARVTDGASQNASSTTTTSTTVRQARGRPVPDVPRHDVARGVGRQTARSGSSPTRRAGVAGCLDVVTFTFQSLGSGTPPGYVVEYKDPPFSDGDPPREVSARGRRLPGRGDLARCERRHHQGGHAAHLLREPVAAVRGASSPRDGPQVRRRARQRPVGDRARCQAAVPRRLRGQSRRGSASTSVR